MRKRQNKNNRIVTLFKHLGNNNDSGACKNAMQSNILEVFFKAFYKAEAIYMYFFIMLLCFLLYLYL